mmetsp:Transcript_1500/g.1794  ORF Transcript_1500/g.1794 Transcript_1500/m.1794 type:complete len:131 (+) Transcript_1500:232-624(+)|eukprot:CAMPEP_0204624840 /NCGR_PEP_ID=MMETSP0717-20131115/10603_1 /ASSEMBLY_ACC=CAM_ASM_000666 /TAXON_ID=230516 /ORGANISM="Chaetoceros curvisetus" /LENGTH=130 /DNA_ID=CAMNT_0051640371 /DNA_START=285 /DNA_END=677 /DNA_ORIENTATION=+
MALKYASENLKADREVVLAPAVTEDGKSDREIILAAMTEDGRSFEYATEEFKADREIILAAVSQDVNASTYIAKNLRAYKEIIMAALFAPSVAKEQTCTFDHEGDEHVEIIEYISMDDHLWEDKEITSIN